MKKQNKLGQVWVETVIYTLIGLVLIGTVLAFATPVIQTQKDKATIGRTVSAMTELDNSISNVKSAGISNARQLNFLISEGSLTVDGENDKIIFQIDDSSYAYSEVRTTVDISGTNIKARTSEQGSKYDVTLTLDYVNKLNITYEGDDKSRSLDASSNAYLLIIENGGKLVDQGSSCTVDLDCGAELIYECTPSGKCKPLYTNIDIYSTS